MNDCCPFLKTKRPYFPINENTISSKLVSVERTVLEYVISTRAGVKSKFVFLVGAFLCTLSAFSKTISRVVDR